MMLALMLISLVLGIATAYFGLLPASFAAFAGEIPFICLCVLLVLVGYGIGKDKDALRMLVKRNVYSLLVPLGTVTGTLFGGVVAGLVLNMGIREAMAVAGGFGWYSYSAVYLAEVHSADLGAIAFMSNVFREIFAIFMIPLVVKIMGGYPAISIAGATSMDITMPIVTRYAGNEAGVVSFVHGVIISIIVPFLMPLIIG